MKFQYGGCVYIEFTFVYLLLALFQIMETICIQIPYSMENDQYI